MVCQPSILVGVCYYLFTVDIWTNYEMSCTAIEKVTVPAFLRSTDEGSYLKTAGQCRN